MFITQAQLDRFILFLVFTLLAVMLFLAIRALALRVIGNVRARRAARFRSTWVHPTNRARRLEARMPVAPSPFCADHPNGTPPNCLSCGIHSVVHENATRDRAAWVKAGAVL